MMKKSDHVEWFYKAKWGVFIHYLGQPSESSEEWNSRINNFNVEGLVKQLVELKVKYLIITIGQISGHYCAPNKIYDSITKIQPSKCSKRDLIKDLYAELNKHDIKLMTYFPSDAPRHDEIATKALGWKHWKKSWEKWAFLSKAPKQAGFQRKWESIIREYSLRWGKNIHGWWIDGCYAPKSMYLKDSEPNFRSFAKALRAGNPESIIAFNPGVKVPVISLTEEEDYTAGEIAEKLTDCPGRWINQIQFHILTYLGKYWGQGEPRFSPEFIKDYVDKINSKGGVISWDVGTDNKGLILPDLFECLKVLS